MTRIQIQHDDGTIQENEALGWVSNGDGRCAVVRGADGVRKLEPVEGPDGARVVVSRPFRPVSSRYEIASSDRGASMAWDTESRPWILGASGHKIETITCFNGHTSPIREGKFVCPECPK